MPAAPHARDLAHRLVAREALASSAPDDVAAPAHAACERAFRELSRWLGANGTYALLTRALSQARPQHPALGEIRLDALAEPVLQGVGEAVQSHGPSAVAGALEAVLVELLELLGRLIGDDMSARLVEQGVPGRTPDDETLDRRSALRDQ